MASVQTSQGLPSESKFSDKQPKKKLDHLKILPVDLHVNGDTD